MKYDAKSLNNLNDDISRQRTLFVERLDALKENVLGMGLLATDREHAEATRLLIGAGGQCALVMATLSVLHSLVRIHKPLTATLARGEECNTKTIVDALSKDLVHITVAASQVTEEGLEFWRMLQRSIAANVETLEHLERTDAECRRTVAEAGLDYDKLITGDPDEVARAKVKGIEVHTYQELMQQATQDAPKEMTLNQLMDAVRRGAVVRGDPQPAMSPSRD